MPPSVELVSYIKALTEARKIPIDEKWIPAIEVHLKLLLDAAAVVDKSELNLSELATRFDP
jgi:hypothetical protein